MRAIEGLRAANESEVIRTTRTVSIGSQMQNMYFNGMKRMKMRIIKNNKWME
jgi:hypothetical protein